MILWYSHPATVTKKLHWTTGILQTFYYDLFIFVGGRPICIYTSWSYFKISLLLHRVSEKTALHHSCYSQKSFKIWIVSIFRKYILYTEYLWDQNIIDNKGIYFCSDPAKTWDNHWTVLALVRTRHQVPGQPVELRCLTPPMYQPLLLLHHPLIRRRRPLVLSFPAAPDVPAPVTLLQSVLVFCLMQRNMINSGITSTSVLQQFTPWPMPRLVMPCSPSYLEHYHCLYHNITFRLHHSLNTRFNKIFTTHCLNSYLQSSCQSPVRTFQQITWFTQLQKGKSND